MYSTVNTYHPFIATRLIKDEVRNIMKIAKRVIWLFCFLNTPQIPLVGQIMFYGLFPAKLVYEFKAVLYVYGILLFNYNTCKNVH